MSASGYNAKSEFAYSFSIKENAKGEFYIDHITMRSNEKGGLPLVLASYTYDVLRALKSKGFKVVGLPDNKN